MTRIANRQDAVNPAELGRRRTAAGDAFSTLAIRIIQLHGQLIAAGDSLARPVGQSSARWQVLAGAEDGNRTVSDIARALGLARQSIQRLADLLESEGLIAYVDNPRHRRAKLIVLTVSGRRALDAIQAAQGKWANAMGAELGERRLREAADVLERVQMALATAQRRPG
jgi:DNA-binding MarR family transcriptional regulator